MRAPPRRAAQLDATWRELGRLTMLVKDNTFK